MAEIDVWRLWMLKEAGGGIEEALLRQRYLAAIAALAQRLGKIEAAPTAEERRRRALAALSWDEEEVSS
jgi:hypothetical protein